MGLEVLGSLGCFSWSQLDQGKLLWQASDTGLLGKCGCPLCFLITQVRQQPSFRLSGEVELECWALPSVLAWSSKALCRRLEQTLPSETLYLTYKKPSGNANTFYQEHHQKASGLENKVLWVRVSVRFKSAAEEKD